ncbi:hypothetical protein ACJMK2_019592 [Sinanodonta woodiana]|uniref:Uncharacterized protein n=1 Tax=Sinanodonta woodiana TaxID=1069815 RepID=A0ABD3TWJ5_SINWO
MRISHFLRHFSMFNKVKNMQYYSNIQKKQSNNIALSKRHLKMSGIPQKTQKRLQKGSQEIKAGHAANTESEEGKKKRYSVGLLNKIRLRKNSSNVEQDRKKTGKEKLLKQGSTERIKTVTPEAVESDDVHVEISGSKSVEVYDNHIMDNVPEKPVGDAKTKSSTGFRTDGLNKDECDSLGDEKNADMDLEIRKSMVSELELCERKKYQENGTVKGSETSSGSASSMIQQQRLHSNVPGERRLSILGGDLRRRSLFEEAVENNQNADFAINDAIETELTNMKKRGSISLALFKDDVMSVTPCNEQPKSRANSTKDDVMSVTPCNEQPKSRANSTKDDVMSVKPCNEHLKSRANSTKENSPSQGFTHSCIVKMRKPDGNKSNNANKEKPSKTRKQMKLRNSKKLKTKVPDGCQLCGNGTCLYPLAPWQELLKCQLSAAMYNIKHHDRFRTFFDSRRSGSESNLFSQSKFTES